MTRVTPDSKAAPSHDVSVSYFGTGHDQERSLNSDLGNNRH
jgi:hypothetical protein